MTDRSPHADPADDAEYPRPPCRAYIDRKHRGSRGRTAALFLITLAVVAALAWGVVQKVNQLETVDRRTNYRPLTDYPTARILDRVPRVPGPALAVTSTGGEPLHIDGQVCNRTPRLVDVRSSLTWIPYVGGTLQRGHEFSQYAGADETRPVGCTGWIVGPPNPVPVTVTRTNALLGPRAVWRVELADTPVSPTGTSGVRVRGYTEPFRLVPR